METIELTQEQHDIYVFAMEQSPLSPNASLKNYSFDAAVTENHIIAYARMGTEEQNAWGIISLPEISTKVFIGITDADPEQYSELIAGFEAESEVNDSMGLGHVTSVELDLLNQAGWSGIVVTKVSELVDGFPDSAVLNGEVYDFQLVVPITQKELKYGLRKGGFALIEKMRDNNRDFFSFNQSPSFEDNVEVAIVQTNAEPELKSDVEIKVSTSATSESIAALGDPRQQSTKKHVAKTKSKNRDRDRPHSVELEPPRVAVTASTRSTNNDAEKKESTQETFIPLAEQLTPQAVHSNELPGDAQGFDKVKLDRVIPIPIATKENSDSVVVKPKKLKKKSKLSIPQLWHVSKKHQVIGETVIGTLLLVGGAFLSGRLYSGNFQVASVFTAVFSIAGLIILYSAFKDSQALND